jgi:hypothetical protein
MFIQYGYWALSAGAVTIWADNRENAANKTSAVMSKNDFFMDDLKISGKTRKGKTPIRLS